MIIETTVAKSASLVLPKVIKSAACMIGKQALAHGTKEALDHAFRPGPGGSLTNLTRIEQALFALELSRQESDDLVGFFSSPVFENWIRAIGLLAGVNESGLASQGAVLTELLNKVIPEMSPGGIASLSSAILDFVVQAAGDAWKIAVELGAVGQSWSTESIVQSAVADQLANARNQVEQRVAAASASFQEIGVFVDRYKSATLLATSTIKPQSVNESIAIPVEDLYVEPLVNFESEKGVIPCRREMLFASSRRSVLLGNPGGGKSTLANKLCHDICAKQIDDSFFDVPSLAVQIILREYAQHLKEHPCSIIEYLEILSNSAFQIEPPAGAFKLLLMSGRILVIFDGLDELIEIRDRTKVSSAVEHFAHEYPVASILVTSREVGYEQAPLDKSRFNHYKLNPFDEEQVRDYANKWFRRSYFPNAEEGARLANAFVGDSSIIIDIRSNPLMLGLLCNLYRQDGFIPNNRPQVYQRCADLLFAKWDQSRGIKIQLPLDHRLRPAMSFLAHWIYSDEQLQGGVTETRLIEKTAQYLSKWEEDDAKAESFAQEFVTFFKGRAWVFTDTGSDKNESLYQFTHRTFLEYFTAEELVRLHPRAEDLHSHLISRIQNRSWDVVCQLAYQLSVQRMPSDDTLVDLLCRDSLALELHQKLNVLSFLARTMDPLYPMPRSRREVVRLCTETVFENVGSIAAGAKNFGVLATEILNGILNSAEEALNINASEVAGSLHRIISSEDIPSSARADAILLSSKLHVISQLANTRPIDPMRGNFWAQQSENLAETTRPAREAISRIDRRVATLSWERAEIRVAELVTIFGPPVILVSTRTPVLGYLRWAIGTNLVLQALGNRLETTSREAPESGRLIKWRLEELDSVAELLLGFEPWIEEGTNLPENVFLRAILDPAMFRHPQVPKWPKKAKTCESILVVLAFMAEVERLNPDQLPPTDGMLSDLATFCCCRESNALMRAANAIVDQRCVSKRVKEKLHAWTSGEISLTRKKL